MGMYNFFQPILLAVLVNNDCQIKTPPNQLATIAAVIVPVEKFLFPTAYSVMLLNRRLHAQILICINYVLMHGAWRGSWCFEKFDPLLSEKMNSNVYISDLPWHYKNPDDFKNATLDSYVDSIANFIESNILVPKELMEILESIE
jgi:hypothetical protein